MKGKKTSIAVGVVLVLAMLASISSAQGSYPDPGTSVTNIVVQNTSTATGDTASVVVEYYDTAGNLDLTNSSVTIEPKAVQEIKTENEALGDGWQGSAVMSSDKSLAAIVSIKNTSVPGAPDGYTQGAYNGSSSGAATLYFPSVYGFSGIVSRLTVQNTESDQATIHVSYYDRDGNFLGTKDDTIPAFSQKTYFMGDSDDVPFDPDNFVDGSAVVTSDGNLLAGAAVTTWANRSGSYQALTDANKGTTLYAPSHYRFDSSPGDNKYGLFSAVNVQNTSAIATAHVTATYYTRGDISGVPALTLNFDIPALSATGLNTKNGGDFDASDFEPLSKVGGGVPDWDGSVTIESNQDLVAICNTVWDTSGHAGVYALVTANDGADSLFVPAQYRREVGWGWAQWSALNLMNVGDSTVSASDLTIQYIDQDGIEVASFSGSDLPGDLAAGAAVGLNTRNGGDLAAGDFDPLSTSFIGGIYVTGPTGSQLVGVANIIYSNRASVYNAFPGN